MGRKEVLERIKEAERKRREIEAEAERKRDAAVTAARQSAVEVVAKARDETEAWARDYQKSGAGVVEAARTRILSEGAKELEDLKAKWTQRLPAAREQIVTAVIKRLETQ